MEPIYLILDTETGGVDPQKSALLQIAATLVGDKRDGASSEQQFNTYILNGEGEHALEVHPKAVEVNGLTPEKLKEYGAVAEAAAYKKFTSFLSARVDKFDKTDKFHLVGYNVRFDEEFIRAMFLRHGDKYYGSWFWSGSIDVMTMASLYLAKERHAMKDFKLTTVAPKILGQDKVDSIFKELGDAHNAVVDVALTKQLFLKLAIAFGYPAIGNGDKTSAPR